MPSLIPLAGEPRTFEVGARAVVGRDPTCEVCVEDPSVSRRHAEIRLLEDGRYEVVDLASKHGVVVRGEKVQKAVLAHGDELQIGLARFRFQSQDPALGSTELRISVADVPGFRPAALIASETELRRDYDKLRAGIELSRASDSAARRLPRSDRHPRSRHAGSDAADRPGTRRRRPRRAALPEPLAGSGGGQGGRHLRRRGG